MDYPGTSFSNQGFAGGPSLRQTVTANVDYTVSNVRQYIDDVEVCFYIVIRFLKELFYLNGLIWI